MYSGLSVTEKHSGHRCGLYCIDLSIQQRNQSSHDLVHKSPEAHTGQLYVKFLKLDVPSHVQHRLQYSSAAGKVNDRLTKRASRPQAAERL